MRDLADFRDSVIKIDGRYRDDRLRTYLAYEDHWAYLIRVKQDIAGFALLRKSKPGTYVIGEFFIKSEYRRNGVGAAAVDLLLKNFDGDWQIPFQNENSGGAAFWRRVVSGLGYEVTEVHSPKLRNSNVYRETWLSLKRLG